MRFLKHKQGKGILVALGLMLSLGMTSFSSLAAIDSTGCNNCTDAQMRQKAENSVRQQGTSYVVVIDYKQQKATKFRLSLTFSSGEPELSATPVSMSADELHDVGIFYQYRRARLDWMRAAEKLPIFDSNTMSGVASGVTSESIRSSSKGDNSLDVGEITVIGNPYNYLENSRLRNNIYDHFASGGQGLFSQLLSSTVGKIAIPLTNDLAIKLTIRFYNDFEATEYLGKLIVELNSKTEEFDSLSGRDAANNSIPLKQSDVTGSGFVFFDNNRSLEFLLHISRKYPRTTCQKVESKDNISGGFVITYRCR